MNQFPFRLRQQQEVVNLWGLLQDSSEEAERLREALLAARAAELNDHDACSA